MPELNDPDEKPIDLDAPIMMAVRKYHALLGEMDELRGQLAQAREDAALSERAMRARNTQLEGIRLAQEDMLKEQGKVIAQLRDRIAELEACISDLWNECDKLPHERGCDPCGTGYCSCVRGEFNGMISSMLPPPPQ